MAYFRRDKQTQATFIELGGYVSNKDRLNKLRMERCDDPWTVRMVNVDNAYGTRKKKHHEGLQEQRWAGYHAYLWKRYAKIQVPADF